MGVTLALLGSPVAQADNDSFVTNAKALGFQQDSDNLISTARSACYFLSRNRHPAQVAERIMRYTSVDSGLARQFLALSVNEYCPQYGGQIGV
ncbi:MAG: DUF732 domain-containing protein [Actinomycetota bacterium]|nr:DUF732 domain-containing protein [Actinomycetota bacterium]